MIKQGCTGKGLVRGAVRMLGLLLLFLLLFFLPLSFSVKRLFCEKSSASIPLENIVSLWGIRPVHAAPPVARIAGDSSRKKNWPLGRNVILDGTTSIGPDGSNGPGGSDGLPLKYGWFGPFGTTSGPRPSVFIPEGTYTVTLIVSAGGSFSKPYTTLIRIKEEFKLTTYDTTDHIRLSWLQQKKAERYDIYRALEANPGNFRKIGEAAPSRTSYRDGAVTENNTYLYTVAAVVGSFAQGNWRFSDVVSGRRKPAQGKEQRNAAPLIYSTEIMEGAVDVPYSYDVNATDPEGDSLRYALAMSPRGMTIDSDTGLVSWVPYEPGTFQVAVVVTDGQGNTDNQKYIIYAKAPSILKPQPNPSGLSGKTQASLKKEREKTVSRKKTEIKQHVSTKVTGKTIKNRPPQISLQSTSYEIATGEILIVHVSATDPDADVVTLYSTPHLGESFFNTNAGLRATGTLTFKPQSTQKGARTVTFIAKDAFGNKTEKKVHITVKTAGNPPVERANPATPIIIKAPRKTVDEGKKASSPQPLKPILTDQTDIAGKRPYSVQVNAMLNATYARQQARDLRKKGYDARIFEVTGRKGRYWHTVRIGSYSSWESANEAARNYRKQEGSEAFVVQSEALKAIYKAPSKKYVVRVSAFSEYENAENRARDLASRGYAPCILELWDNKGRLWYTTQIGAYNNRTDAEKAAARFEVVEKCDARVYAMDPFLLSLRKRWCP